MPQINNKTVTPLMFLKACNDQEVQQVFDLLRLKEFATRIVIREDEPPISEYMYELMQVCRETGIPLKPIDDRDIRTHKALEVLLLLFDTKVLRSRKGKYEFSGEIFRCIIYCQAKDEHELIQKIGDFLVKIPKGLWSQKAGCEI